MTKLLEFLVKLPVQHQEIAFVTWSPKGIRIAYSNAMVVYLSADDMYPLAEKAKVDSLVASERRNMIPGAA